jgi:hypothetical protein
MDRHKAAGDLDVFTRAVSAAHGVRPADIFDGVKRRAVVVARQHLAALLHAAGRYSQADVAELIGLESEEAVRHMLRRHQAGMRDLEYASGYLRVFDALLEAAI